jgi:enediyne biosynthesis protein E4
MYYPEIMAPGVALLDFDNDGDLDVYVVQGQMLGPGKTLADATFPPDGELRDRLFRNDLQVNADGTRVLRFTDVTDESGIDVRTYGMGVAAGDFDNDGFVDIYRTGLSGSVLLRNNGDGTFSDVTERSGTGNPGGWGVSASFVDYDRDGWLDLYVGNYLVYRIEADLDCQDMTGQGDYCPPNSYRAQPDRLYRNLGNGRFADVTTRALVGGAFGPALGVSTADFNGDGWIDIYVGNDGAPNQLWINQKNGTFRDTAFLGGAAVSGAGNSEASMGIDAGDFDNDGDEDLFVTNWMSQMNVLYVNDGTGTFEDRRAPAGLGTPSLAKTGFGTAFFDFDNDGLLDLLAVNGSVARVEAQARNRDPFPLKMANQLYRNMGGGRFEDVSARAGDVFARLHVSRGAAFGDVDNDGDIDVVIGNAAGPLELLINNVGSQAAWAGVRLVGTAGRRDMLGARVAIEQTGRPTLWRRARADGSYASANDPRVLVGLGETTVEPRVRVQWPDGSTETWSRLPLGRWTTLEQGTGE